MFSDRIWEALEDWGADVPLALTHLQGDKEFYLHLIREFLEGRQWCRIGEAVQAWDMQEAFRYAHEMKGVVSLLGFAPVYDLTGEIVEILRTCPSEKSEKPEEGSCFPERLNEALARLTRRMEVLTLAIRAAGM